MDPKTTAAQDTLKIEELAERSGISVRTVRYYLQRGLLPAPQFRGRETVYPASAVERLQAIRQLQERMLPLDAIAALLEPLPPHQVALVAQGLLTIDPTGRLLLQGSPAPLPRIIDPISNPADKLPPGTSFKPMPVVTQRAPAVTHWRRIELAPGLELHVDAERLSGAEHVKGTADALRLAEKIEKAARALLDSHRQP